MQVQAWQADEYLCNSCSSICRMHERARPQDTFICVICQTRSHWQPSQQPSIHTNTATTRAVQVQMRFPAATVIESQLEHAQYKCKYASQKPFTQPQPEHMQYKRKYTPQQQFIERQLWQEQNRFKYASQQPLSWEHSRTGESRVAMVVPAGAGADSAVGTRPVVTMGQALALLGHRAGLRTM